MNGYEDFDMFRQRSDWTTMANIERDVVRTVPRWLLRGIAMTEEQSNRWFGVVVKLYPWAWIGLGYFHRKYQRMLTERCEALKPVGTIGKVVVR